MRGTMRCVIADDEPVARRGIESYVRKLDWLECIGTFSSAAELDEFLRIVPSDERPDIIFIDIDMPGQSGLDYIGSHSPDAAVIIITAYGEYALQGYELNVTDYLLKPVSLPRFIKAAEKARNFRNAMNGYPQQSETIYLKSDRGIHRISVADIIYIEGMENYLKVHTSSDCTIVRMTMKSLMAMLPHDTFMQVHKSFIVNLDKICRIGSNSIILAGSVTVPLSVRHRRELLDRLSADH